VASHNRRESLRRVLEALAAQSYPFDRFEVVVVLDGSTDGSAELVRGLEVPYRLRLVEQPNLGLAATRNRGARETSNELVVFLDDDILVERDCLAAYAEAHRTSAGKCVVLGAAPPRLDRNDGWSRWVRDWWDRHYRRKAEPGHRWTFVDVADGMASLPRDLFLHSGGFDEAFRGRRQDWEWGVRLLRDDVHLTQSLKAIGKHELDASISTALRYARVEGRSDVQLGSKHPEVRGRLPMARFARKRSRFGPTRLTWRYPQLSSVAAWALSSTAIRPVAASSKSAALERLVGLLRTHAYALGIRDALGSAEAIDAFLEPIAHGVGLSTITVDLDHPDWLNVPPVGGELLLAVMRGGDELARVPALEPGEQWDWDALTERVVRAVLEQGKSPSSHPADL
jgi:GT2 family glycosyltransferase